MKVLIPVIILLACVLSFCIFVSIQANEQSMVMVQWLEEAKTACQRGDWIAAEGAWASYAELWERNHTRWLIWLRHMELDWVEQAYARAEGYLSQHNADHFVAETNLLIMIHNMIPDNESLRWDIIF